MVLLLFRIIVVLGAFLLFLIQPLMTKAALPLLGGSPGVWNAAMVFFQTVLLLGYLYAHVLSSGKISRVSGAVHVVLLLLALAVLKNPAMTSETALKNALTGFDGEGAMSGITPLVTLITFLTVQVGLPFLMLSATSPLFQNLLSRCPDKGGPSPYSLAVLSNAGSLLALLLFPFLLEPAVGLSILFAAWNTLFVGYAGLTALAMLVTRSWPTPEIGELTSEEQKAGEQAAGPGPWLLFSFLPACLLQGVTFYLITEIASLPLLWVIPLALYLVTFMIAFSSWRSAGLWLGARGFALLLAPLAVLLTSEISQPRLVVMGVHVLAFFCGTLMCHCRLAELAPEYRRLTGFYVWMSLGGILGGAAHSLVAPFLWNGIYEYPLTLIAMAACLPAKPSAADAGWVRDLSAPVGVVVLCLCGFAGVARLNPGDPSLPLWVLKITGVSCFLFSARPRRYALALGALFVMSSFVDGASGRDLWRDRSFFGIHRVAVSRAFDAKVLVHGSTLHGMQSLNPQIQDEPLLYYDRAGPAGSVFAGLRHALALTALPPSPASHQASSPPILLSSPVSPVSSVSFPAAASHTEALLPVLPPSRPSPDLPTATVGIVGLGAGSLFAYSQPGDRWTIFEIDPSVLRIAADPRYFSFLVRSPASMTTRLGDARLRLNNEPDGAFDLLVLDAYSSDAVPAHLLTREALSLYRRKIKPQGVLAFHLSNTFFTLEPIVAALADSLGLRLLIGESEALEEHRLLGAAPSTWGVVLPPDHALIPWFKIRGWREFPSDPRTRLWTDDYSSLLPFLRANPFWPVTK
jgi:hypothetical protein